MLQSILKWLEITGKHGTQLQVRSLEVNSRYDQKSTSSLSLELAQNSKRFGYVMQVQKICNTPI